MTISAASLIAKYDLTPHPEGGFYKQTYISNERIPAAALPERFSDDRYFSTAIYFLLEKGNFSAFHRIKSDEVWHFYAGGNLNIYIIHQEGNLEVLTLGDEITGDSSFQLVVPAGCWFASEPGSGVAFSFVGCTVSPGFDFADFELANAIELAREYPAHKAIIERLCR